CSALFGDPHQSAEGAGGEDDCAVLIPCSAAAIGGVGKRLNGTACRGYFAEFVLGEEADPGAVGRPEGVSGAIGSGERVRFGGPERAHPDLGGIAVGGDPCEGAAVRREFDKVAGGLELQGD